jgi:N utilization substance protein A
VRDAERDIIFNEYKDRQGQLIRGIVRRFEKGHNIVVDLGRTEGVLPAREQTPRETYRPGDRIVAFVKNIDRESRGPMIILSRQSPHLVEKLFEAEVPEIYEGIVKIVSVAREPSSRSKIAVTSRDPDVDPVGACVGIKGSRVQAVVQELRGEKIDIVPYDKDPARYIINPIQPAEGNRVVVAEANPRMELVVPDEKLSLAIGRKGQNVRLASQLTGWRLDIVSESKFRQMEDEAMIQLAEIEGMDEELAKNLFGLGFRALDEIAEAELAELATIEGVEDEERAGELQKAAERALERLRQERIRRIAEQSGAITDHDALLVVPGMGTRTAQALEESGYKSVRDVAKEDPDRLAIKSGLGNKKARQVWQGAVDFQRTVAKEIQVARERLAEQRAGLDAQAEADVAASTGAEDEEVGEEES